MLGGLKAQVAAGVTDQLYAYVVGKQALGGITVEFVAATINAGGKQPLLGFTEN